VLAATNRDLATMVADGRFRQDLYYRIRVVPVMLPSLAERREDIPLLVDHFVRLQALKTGKPIREVAPKAMAALCAYDYPGNVRELQNLVERAFVLCHGPRIEPGHLPAEVLASRASPPTLALGGRKPSERTVLRAESATKKTTAEPVAQRLLEALAAHGWNRTSTAASLGIGRNTLWRRMREHGLLSGRRGKHGT
jgi:DNA-binding NtrC family response regulator